MTIANEQRPLLFSDYVGQEGVVKYLQSVIKTNKHPNGLLITGGPGLGKTSAAYIYARATLCENRKEGDYEACGKCQSCLSKIEGNQHPNITYYRITEASVFKEAVNDLISMTKARPVLTHENNRADNIHRFIIIDEVQSASRASISPFLDSLEFAVPNVTVILISMDLNRMDPIVKEAIESRCIELSMYPLTEEQIENKICNKYSIDKEAAKLIAYLSKGNVRLAWSILEYFETMYSTSELTPSIIARYKLNGLDRTKCSLIIESLEIKDWNNSLSLIKELLRDNEHCVDYLLQYLADCSLTIDGIKLVSTLSLWLQCNYKSPLNSVFRQFQGITLLQKEVVSSHISDTVKASVIINPPTKEPTNILADVKNQLEKMTGKELQLDKELSSAYLNAPRFLSFTTWKLFLDNYDSNK